MGFWSWLLKDDLNTREETITPPVSDVLLKALLSNEVITREKALTLPVVSGAVDFITNSVASMPVKLYKTKQGKVEEMTDDPRVKLLNGDTGDTLDAFQLKKAMVEDYLLGKGGYCYIERDRNDVVALRYVEDQYITILKNFKPIFKDYVILVEGAEYQPYEFIKLLRNTKDGGSGVGLTAEVSKALETAYQTLLYQLAQVQAGGNKKGFLKSQRTLGQEEINTLKKAWNNMYGNGTENVVVLNNGIEFQESGASAMDMQLDQNKNTLRSEINYIFHINEGDFELTFKEAIYPIIKAFETALNRDLLLEKEKKNYFFEFDVKEIVKASLIERYNAYKTAKETGWLSYNEIRKMENMEYVDGLDVVNVGLGAVLYDIKTHKYYTPNTDTVSDPNDNSNGGNPEEEMDTMLEHHEEVEAFDESGNDAERQIRFNENHDGKTGRFAPKSGSGGGGASDEFIEKFGEYAYQLPAIKRYVGTNDVTSDSRKLNRKLSNANVFGVDLADGESEDAETVKALDKAMDISPLEKDMTLYSGKDMAYFKNAKVGDVIDMNGTYTSSSESKQVAEKFANGGAILEIKAPKGTPSINVSKALKHTKDNANASSEKERILSRKLKYKITEIDGNNIHLEIQETNKRSDNLRFNDVHDSKTGRFGSKWGGSVNAMEAEFNNLPDNKKALFLKKNEFLSNEDALKHWKEGNIDQYGKEYFQILRENGDYNPIGETRDNTNRASELVRNGEYSDYGEARKALLKQDTNFSDDEAERTYNELNTWVGNSWSKADTKTLDRYVENSPSYDGKMYRGLHFDTPEEAEQFTNLKAGDRITGNGKNSSWTSDEEMSRVYSHNANDSITSVNLVCLKNKTSSPIEDFNRMGEAEVLASSKTEWTVLRNDVVTLPNGNKKIFTYVVEAENGSGKSNKS